MSDFFTQPPKRHRSRTDHVVAVKCRDRGWAGHATRAEWESTLRFKGKFTISETPKTKDTYGA